LRDAWVTRWHESSTYERVERMEKRRLDVGAIVQLAHTHRAHVATTSHHAAVAFRIEELLRLDNGITLYKVKSENEPFDRIVAECDLAPRP
jgi:hypothetical protein